MSDPSSIFCHTFSGSSGQLLKLHQGDALRVSTQHSARPLAMKPATSQSLISHPASAINEGVDAELWYACAGPHKTLPPVNSEVAYLPQGHIEQVASFNNQDVDGQIPRYNLPAVIPCTLNDVQLSADPETDEVFATLTLCPMSEPRDESSDSLELSPRPKRKSNSFTKTLTVSDTSTHGGFSVPRRAAEECLPPLDKSQDPPTQELVAKDLHGNEWKFRHIFRGQPKRHLLTTGWSVFVSQKRLVAGDAVLFLRGENGQLRIGVRRAPRQQQKSKVLTSPTMTLGVLAAAAHAASEKSRFSLIYNPRSCPSDFVIPYKKYLIAVKNFFTVGLRFKRRFESEDSSDCRFTGTITGITDYDPARWPSSAWRSLQVNWDESAFCDQQERISPWEIGPFADCFTLPPQLGTTRKRPRLPLQCYAADHNLGISPGGLDDSLQLQTFRVKRALHGGQDSKGMPSSLLEEVDGEGTVLSHMSSGIKLEGGLNTEAQVGVRAGAGDCWLQMRKPESVQASDLFRGIPRFQDLGGMVGIERSQQQHRKLCVQQCCEQYDNGVDPGATLHLSHSGPSTSKSFIEGRPLSDTELQLCVSSQSLREHNRATSSSLLWPIVSSSCHPSPILPSSEICGNDWVSGFRPHLEVMASSAVSSRPDCTALSIGSLPTFDTGSSSRPATPKSKFWENQVEPEPDLSHSPAALPGEQKCKIFGVPLDKLATAAISSQMSATKVFSDLGDVSNLNMNRCIEKIGASGSSGNLLPACMEGSKLEKTRQRCKAVQNWPQAPVRSFIKVHKQGAIGRSIDIMKFDGYGGLLEEVEEMFGLEGVLFDKKSGWQLVYTDHEEDVLLVGDDPWVEFCSCVRSIRVLSLSEVLHMGKSRGAQFSGKEEKTQSEDVHGKDDIKLGSFQDSSLPS